MIIKTFEVSPFMTNCYLVGSDKTREAVVIDPGDSIDWIIESAEKDNLKITKILNTHAHIDHVAGVKEMKEMLKIPFYLHKEDEHFLPNLPQHGIMFGWHVEGYPEVDEYLNDGDIIECGDISISVLHTPGHSPGGVCFVAGKNVFAGDTLFAGSIGRTDLPGGSYHILINSIHQKLMTLDEDFAVYSGHGPSTTIGTEKKSNPFLQS
jgi:glyoxylase-like metal-dependent hydrolase (beta-lactamase superfamily II)